MAITDQLGAPGINIVQSGQYSLNRIVRVEASAAAPVTPTNMSYIVALDVDDGAPEITEVFQQGGGDERSLEKRKWKWSGTITVHKGKLPSVVAQLMGTTWDTGNDAAIPFKIPTDYPHVHWEAVCREKDNTTHIYSVIFQDMIIDNLTFTNPMDIADGTISFHSYYPPTFLAANSQMVYDVFTGDGSTTSFTASSTPLSLLTAANHDDFFLAQAISIKEKASTASTGTRKKSGYSYTGGNFVAATAPAASTLVQILYATTV